MAEIDSFSSIGLSVTMDTGFEPGSVGQLEYNRRVSVTLLRKFVEDYPIVWQAAQDNIVACAKSLASGKAPEIQKQIIQNAAEILFKGALTMDPAALTEVVAATADRQPAKEVRERMMGGNLPLMTTSLLRLFKDVQRERASRGMLFDLYLASCSAQLEQTSESLFKGERGKAVKSDIEFASSIHEALRPAITQDFVCSTQRIWQQTLGPNGEKLNPRVIRL